MLKKYPFGRVCLLLCSFIMLLCCTSCLAPFDASNFGDVKKLKRIMLDESWKIDIMEMESTERPSRSDPWSVTLDTVVASAGTMYFEKDSKRGRHNFTYTDDNGVVKQGQIVIEADVNDDNPTVQFDISPTFFPHPHRVSDKFKVISFGDSHLEFYFEFWGTGDLTHHEYTIELIN